MSKLTDTKLAYDKFADLIDQEIRNRRGSSKELDRFRQTLDVAFYLLGWAQFEYLAKNEAEDRISEQAQAKVISGHAWRYLRENIKGFPLRRKLDLIFHGDQKTLDSLNKDYDLRNDAAHDYKHLPKDARDISDWLHELENLVSKF